VEQIKRENKLWTNDSLFLREFLYIPVTNDNSHLVQDDWEILTADEVRSRSNSSNNDLLTSPEHGARGSWVNDANGATGCENSGKDTKTGGKSNNDPKVNNVAKSGGDFSSSDFFSKYDNSIAALKTKVDEMEKSSRYVM